MPQPKDSSGGTSFFAPDRNLIRRVLKFNPTHAGQHRPAPPRVDGAGFSSVKAKSNAPILGSAAAIPVF
jgi:hypothetical protein